VTRDRRLGIALALNVALVAGQVFYGVAAHSLGLLADAGHNLTDAGAVAISLLAVRIARRAPDEAKSFGYHRATILAALVNSASLIAVSGFIGFEAVRRLSNPQPVRGGLVVTVGLAAFAANGVAALVLRERRPDANMQSAVLHMAGDAGASIGVVLAGSVIALTGGNVWIDPAVSIAVALLIAVKAWGLVRGTADVLLEATPKDMSLERLRAAIAQVGGVAEAHDVHVWSLSSELRALSARVVVEGHPTLEEAQVVGGAVRRVLEHDFAVAHATIELECERCADEDDSGCGLDDLEAAAARGGHRH